MKKKQTLYQTKQPDFNECYSVTIVTVILLPWTSLDEGEGYKLTTTAAAATATAILLKIKRRITQS